MLVIVEHGNGHELLELLLYVETVRALDILKIDASERWGQMLYAIHKVILVGSIYAEVDAIDASKLFEEDRLSLHHWLRGQGSNVTKA